MGLSENKECALPRSVRSSNEKSVPLLGLIVPEIRTENMRRRSKWRSGRDSNSRYEIERLPLVDTTIILSRERNVDLNRAWRLGFDSQQAKSRPYERLSDFLL
jgi:hypothetical protein